MFGASVMGLRSSYQIAVELVHHDVEPGLVVLGVVEHVHQVRPGGDVRILQALGDVLLQLLGG